MYQWCVKTGKWKELRKHKLLRYQNVAWMNLKISFVDEVLEKKYGCLCSNWTNKLKII